MIAAILILQIVCLCVFAYVCYKYIRLKDARDNEYYTDYVHGNLILRIYKPEFEYQAIGNVSRDKLLDRGNFSQFYIWALIQK